MTHELKTWPVYFQAILDGTKTFEVRRYDRPFMVGDVLDLREYDWKTSQYTGRRVPREVCYILGPEDDFGFDGFVVMGIRVKFHPPSRTCVRCDRFFNGLSRVCAACEAEDEVGA